MELYPHQNGDHMQLMRYIGLCVCLCIGHSDNCTVYFLGYANAVAYCLLILINASHMSFTHEMLRCYIHKYK